jgi:predicted metal-dependent peptidase
MSKIAKREAKRVSKIRLEMLQNHPFWGYLLLQIKILAAPDLPCIAATDCVHYIWYNPKLTKHLNHAQLGFVLAHELGHQIYASHRRRGRRNAQLWNCATDYAINRIIAQIAHPVFPRKALYQPPEGKFPELGEIKILLDSKYDGMIAETIFESLDAKQLPSPTPCEITVQVDCEDEAGHGGQGRAIRIPNLSDHGGGIDIHLPDNLSQDDLDEIESRIQAAVDHWHDQSDLGHAPTRLIEDLGLTTSAARQDWRSIFRNHAQTALAADEYTLSRPHKRYLDLGFIVPSLHGERVPHLVVSIDTSGSMSPEMLKDVSKELRAISQNVERMTLIVADQEVLDVVDDHDLERFLGQGKIRGGRGTDHRPVFQWMAACNNPPDLYVGLTDLYTQFPENPPPYPVLWLTPEEHYSAPPWGTVINVKGVNAS